MRRDSSLAFAAVLLAALILNNEAVADAVALPPLGLGNTSFMDGVAGPGKLFELPLQVNHANEIKDAGGHAVSGRQRINSVSVLPHFAYIGNTRILGVLQRRSAAAAGAAGSRYRQAARGHENAAGRYDRQPAAAAVGPMQLLGRPFWQRLNFVFSLPTGDNDDDATINVGSNEWVFNPHYAFTWELSTRREFSGSLHYAWSSRNSRPSSALGADDVQPGQAFHANYSLSYALDDAWRVGLAGYYLAQT